MIFEQLSARRKEERRQYNRECAAASRERVSQRIRELEAEATLWRTKVHQAVIRVKEIEGQEDFAAGILAELNTAPKKQRPQPLEKTSDSVIMSSSPKKSYSRESEIALLKQLSTSLDSYTGKEERGSLTVAIKKKWPKPMKKLASVQDTSKTATKNFLAVKQLVRGLVKACIEENVKNKEKTIGVIDRLVEEYRVRGYPTLTKQMVTDGIARHMKSQENTESGKNKHGKPAEDGDDDVDDDLKLNRCIQIVDGAMDEYFERIEALKRRRETAASEPDVPDETPERTKKRKSSGDDAEASSSSPKKLGRPRGRPKKVTPETALVDEITERYVKAREERDRLPNGAFETIVEETKKEFGMEDFNVPLNHIRKRVTWKYINRPDKNSTRTKKKDVTDEVYQRYSRAKEMNGGKLPPGTLESIVEGVKLEYGMADVKMSTLETKVQTRFKKENPEFKSTPEGVLEIGKLSEDENRRRQILMNEVTTRYVRAKEEGPKKLPDGELDRIIEQAKTDLGILDFDVPKASIRGRINRKSLQVMTLGSTSPYDVIDVPLVATINNWLSQGISVTRGQGLEFANTLLKGKNMEKNPDGKEILLDAKWWRNFLERNKKKLVCSSD
ncbi:hypothetical protein ACHAXR_011162 [Thalassiosira sp. AJA248-18]